jgi:hypothetical protein
MEEVSTSVAEELKNKIGLTFETLLVPYGEMPRGREDKRIQVDPDQFS